MEELLRKGLKCLKKDDFSSLSSIEREQIFRNTPKNIVGCRCKSKIKDAVIYLLTKRDADLRPKYKLNKNYGFYIDGKLFDYVNATDADIETFLRLHPDFITEFIKLRK